LLGLFCSLALKVFFTLDIALLQQRGEGGRARLTEIVGSLYV
jgi:hypothetical protein